MTGIQDSGTSLQNLRPETHEHCTEAAESAVYGILRWYKLLIIFHLSTEITANWFGFTFNHIYTQLMEKWQLSLARKQFEEHTYIS